MRLPENDHVVSMARFGRNNNKNELMVLYSQGNRIKFLFVNIRNKWGIF